MKSFAFENSIKLLCGTRAVSNLPYELSQASCDRPLVVCDESSYRVGFHSYVKQALQVAGVNIVRTFYKTEDIAKDYVCEEIVKLYKAYKCDSIIVIGKKGAVATAKAAKILLCEDISRVGHYRNLGISEYAVRDVPLFVIPTNFGSGTEASNFVRVYSKENEIYEFNTSYATANVVIIDPYMTDIMPPKTIATNMLCALAMAVECYAYIGDSSLVCKAYADAAIKLLNDYAEKCLLRNANVSYRYHLLEAVVLAGAAYSMLDRNLLAELSDVISDRYHVNYQNVFAILFRRYIKTQQKGPTFGYALNSMIDENDYALYAKEMRGQKVLTKIEEIFLQAEAYVEYNTKLSDFNIPKEDLEELADTFMAIHKNEEEIVTKEDVINLLESSY